MRPALLLFAVLSLVVFASFAFAGPPLPGVYTSTDIGGTIPPGHYSEGWYAGGGALKAGTSLHCASWDGTNMGLVWRYVCAGQLTDAVLVSDNLVGGYGQQTWKCTFTGGTFWLGGSGPWANGDPEYPGVFDYYFEYETVTFAGGVIVGAVTNVSAAAHFTGYPDHCMTYGISSGQRVGTTDLGQTEPTTYPAFLDYLTCASTAPLGAWWNMNGMTLVITSGCGVPTKTTSWGAIKTLYR